ncbi:MAG: urea ABC transporter permease subunit UrtB [Alphaproteobacteria bacterium]
MLRSARCFLTAVAWLLALLVNVLPAAAADEAVLRPLVQALAEGSFDDKAAAIQALAGTGDPVVARVLEVLREGDLYQRTSDDLVVIAEKKQRELVLFDPITGEELETVKSRAASKIKVNNRLRRQIDGALGALTLMSPDRGTRLRAAQAVFDRANPDQLEGVRTASTAEQDPEIAEILGQAEAAMVLQSEEPEKAKLAAVDTLRKRGDRAAMAKLQGVVDDDSMPGLQEAARAALVAIERHYAMLSAAQNVYYGLSLGSVLLLAAIGLAITFGVMGVINMAHGEMVMLGAYTTFVIQEIIRQKAPWLFDVSLLIAIPSAFLIAGGVGVLIERGIIRFLYGRPLETLLATWGVSLILQQAVRSIFGPTNQQVGNPSWMSGAVNWMGLTFTYNRLWIIVFSLAVLALLMAAIRLTPFGLQMRAVTQNRQMAGSMGIRTPWVDALTFGLGSGVAGIAGVALSQIDNVSPNLGQGYIIDSFMVVVFGGVGNLWGTLVAAMTLGVANKFLEPYAGAVLAKIFVLVFIILFIQKRPRGLFALKGRAVEV